MGLKEKVRVQVGGQVGCDKLGVLASGLWWCQSRSRLCPPHNGWLDGFDDGTYDNSAFTPSAIPMSTDISNPVALAPNAGTNRYLRV